MTRFRCGARGLGALTLALLLLSGTSARADQAPTPSSPSPVPASAGAVEGQEAARPGPALGVTGQLSTSYTSNLFHEQRRREADFDAKSGPGERYDGMKGPADLVTEAGIGGSAAWPGEGGRTLELRLEAGYFVHLRNTIANYFGLGATARYDLTPRDSLTLGVGAIPVRFKKNYLASQVAGVKTYKAASYRELENGLGYRRRWTKRLKTDVDYVLGIRRYLSPFENRNHHRHELALLARRELGRRFEIGLGAGGALAFTPSGPELGIAVDRSYRDLAGVALARVDLPARFDVKLEGEYRLRRYTTELRANDSYFERSDRRTTIGVESRKRLGESFALFLEASFTRNETNRTDHPTIDPEELGYDEAILGLGVKGSF